MPDLQSVVMEGVRIVFRNFAGREGRYNQEGDRNFAVLLDDGTAERMANDGWNVRWTRPNDEEVAEGGVGQAYLPVAVSYKFRPPTIYMVTSRGKTLLTEDQIEMLDGADIIDVDLIVNPSEWSVSGRSGIKAYLRSGYFTIEEDVLAQKYADRDLQ